MLQQRKHCLVLMLVLCAGVLNIRAQTSERAQAQTPSVTATAAPEQVRFAALGEAAQLRLEVFSQAGDKLFDSEARGATFLDWKLQDQHGQRLPDGTYRCLLTVKAFSGSLAQAHGLILVQAGEVSVQAPDATPSQRTDQQGLPPVDRQELLATVPAGSALATALLAHDGSEGRLVSGSGALSFRLGDFFAGKDQEQMRLTPEGNLGIGITAPKAKLDVAGSIRTSEGIIFPDGTIQTTAANASLIKRRAGQDPKTDEEGKPLALKGNPTQNISGTGTTNRITKWTDGPNGVVGDSTLTESGGNIGIGTPTPATGLDYRHTLAPFLTRDIGTTNFGTPQSAIQIGVTNTASRNVNGGPSFLFFADDTAGQKEFLGRLSAAWENPTNGAEAGSIRFSVRANSADTGALTERMRITAAGNVGIGVTNPSAKLAVAGLIESTSGGIKFPDGTTQTTQGLTAVTTTCCTLEGSGTSASPLSVKAPLTLTSGVISSTLSGVNTNVNATAVGVSGQASGGVGVHGFHIDATGTAPGVQGETNSTAGNAIGVLGRVNSTAPGSSSAAVRGINNGTGAFGIGVYGSQDGSGIGVYGSTPSGRGVHGFSHSGIGVYGGSNTGKAGYFGGEVVVVPLNGGGILIGNPNTSSGGFTSLAMTISAIANGYAELQSIRSAGSAWGDLIVNRQGGNVGIGTASPTTKLHVVGTTQTSILQITGGADLSENFEVKAALEADSDAGPQPVQPGMVVSIDPDNPGKLVISSQAYDRRVAGIISGAGGIKSGMLMGQAGSIADGNQPVALTGRVYCWADASKGSIEPGDLLTTSNVPGHAIKVTDHAKAQGAIIGKAMTALKEGKGLVLVLVSLQ